MYKNLVFSVVVLLDDDGLVKERIATLGDEQQCKGRAGNLEEKGRNSPLLWQDLSPLRE